MQHRTEPFEIPYSWCKKRFTSITKSWTSLLKTICLATICWWSLQAVVQPGEPLPVPDLVKVAGLARAFEPLIFYSENGVTQIGDLQATGVAVWDLGESVRSTNMTSAPIIVKELDELSESLKTLSLELTKFFANVDGDVDGYGRRISSSLRSPANTLPQHPHSNGLGQTRTLPTLQHTSLSPNLRPHKPPHPPLQHWHPRIKRPPDKTRPPHNLSLWPHTRPKDPPHPAKNL